MTDQVAIDVTSVPTKDSIAKLGDPETTQMNRESQTPRRSVRQRQPVDRYVASLASAIEEPRTLKEALASEFGDEWRAATDSEFASLTENRTWTLTHLPEGRRPISCKWVFKVKYNTDGEVDRFKARLVVRGFSQVQGVDYDETFAPVARFTSIRVLIVMAIQKGYSI
jgi:hypothetical protein